MRKISWKRVLAMFLALQFGTPIMLALFESKTLDKDFLPILKEGLTISFFFLLVIFYIPLLFTFLKQKYYAKNKN
jgi:hypothetical protein